MMRAPLMAATVTLRMRPRPLSGPVVRRHPLPVRSLLLSSCVHAIVLGAIIAAALLWRPEPTRTYFVNLVPSVPVLGSPAGRTTTPTTTPPPPRLDEPPKPMKSAAPELPVREVAPKVARPTALPELPVRPAAPPELPARSAAKLPDMPTRDVARETPKPGQKELPALSPSAPPVAPKASSAPATREVAPPAPPPPFGRPTGVTQGSGALASVEGNFPFQWYLTAVQRKVYEQWTQPLSSAQGHRAVIVFEIARNGEVSRARVEKTSGDAAYDLAALRAVASANPLPPLPAEFKGTMIRVHFGFEYKG
jgi:periplasmic protein TonB